MLLFVSSESPLEYSRVLMCSLECSVKEFSRVFYGFWWFFLVIFYPFGLTEKAFYLLGRLLKQIHRYRGGELLRSLISGSRSKMSLKKSGKSKHGLSCLKVGTEYRINKDGLVSIAFQVEMLRLTEKLTDGL